jgi:hypothetical protein
MSVEAKRNKSQQVNIRIPDAIWKELVAVCRGKYSMNPPTKTTLITRGIELAILEHKSMQAELKRPRVAKGS